MGIIVKDGSITLGGSLFIIGIPLLAIGKYHCNNQILHSKENVNCPFVPVPFISKSWNSIPFQWLLGSWLIIVATGAVFLDLISFGKDRRKEQEGSKEGKQEEVELVATHFHHDEILAKIEENIKLYSQSTFTNDSTYDGDDLDASNQLLLGNDLHHDCRKNKTLENTVLLFKQKHLVYLDALTFKVSTKRKRNTSQPDELSELYLSCQDAAYRTLLSFPHHDQILSSALSLLAITAKHPAPCKRIFHMGDRFGLHIPIQAMERSLMRSKNISNPRKEDEFIAAELQRKACIYLGALADGDSQDLNIPQKIIENNGLDAILNAIDWFRYHDEVVNWGLWAIFMICFENEDGKQFLVRMGGIQMVCRALRTILKDYSEIVRNGHDANILNTKSSTMEATRHGVAILFDILRHQEECTDTRSRPFVFDFVELRRMALNAGLHCVVLDAMQLFQENTEIMMMGQQMLVATEYTGDIPEFDGPSSRVPSTKIQNNTAK